MSSPLTKIGDIELLGEKFKLGKNGKVCLVRESPDCWGEVRGDIVSLTSWLGVSAITDSQEEKIQALLDLLGDTLSRLRQSRDSKLGMRQ